MEIPTSVDASELWLRDDLEEVYALLFRFLGFGFRLAMSNVGWHVTQQFVILVPDPIAFAPRPALLDEGEPCDICQYTSFRPRVHALVTPSSYPGSWFWIVRHNTLRRSFAASCATPGRTSNCATSSGTSRDTLSRWTGRTCAPSRTRSAKRWPNTSPSSSWKSSPTSNVSIWTPVPLCSASCCSLALHRLERGGAA